MRGVGSLTTPSCEDNPLIVKCNSALLAEFVIGTLPEDEALGEVDFKPNWD